MSSSGTDQMNHSRRLQKPQRDYAIEHDPNRERYQAEINMLKYRHEKTIQALCEDKSRLHTALADKTQVMDELCSKMKLAENRSADLSQELVSNREHLKLAHQYLEESKRENKDTLKKLHATREDADRLRQSTTDCMYRIRELEQTLAEGRKQLADEKSYHAQAIAALRHDIQAVRDEANNQVDSLIAQHTQDADQRDKTHKAEISHIEQEHDKYISIYQQKIESVKDEAESKRQKQESAYDEQIAQLIREHDGKVAQLQAELAQVTEDERQRRQDLTECHDTQQAQIAEEHKQALSRINEELAEVIQDNEEQIARLKESHVAEQAQRDLNFAQATRQLREDTQKLNAALLTRDDQLYQGELFTTSHLPTRPDEQIRGKFSAIEQMVDNLGRLLWKQEPVVWTVEVLRSVSGNRTDRVLKKAIVQDLVWGLLFAHVFGSPFRVFGAQGRLLEEEWNEQCGQGTPQQLFLPNS
jgi:hypothetical protein